MILRDRCSTSYDLALVREREREGEKERRREGEKERRREGERERRTDGRTVFDLQDQGTKARFTVSPCRVPSVS